MATADTATGQGSPTTDQPVTAQVAADRRRLQEAQAAGLGATLKTFVRLSGPGWLQSAITRRGRLAGEGRSISA